jgi:putative FmdB family regulatory protein
VPLYEYACQECEHEFEALVFNGEKVECPQCRSEKLQKQMSLPGRPKTALPTTACQSSGPPCGPACSRWQK